MKRIAVEEHFSTREHMDALRSIIEQKYPVPEVLQEEKNLQREVAWLHFPGSGGQVSRSETARGKLLDHGAERLKDMDEAGIDMQVLSLVSPGLQVFDAASATAMARRVNDELSRSIKQNPNRFAGLAAVAPQAPNEAATELKRAVTELGLKGAVINSHTKGEYLDDKKYWVILEAAEKLDVPIYIHPRGPSPDMIKPYLAYPSLASAVLGFSAEVSLHALRLIFSGAFDQFPGLKIILGHLGEALPYWMWRIDNHWLKGPGGKSLKKRPSDYLRENFFITTSGMCWHPALMCSYLALGAERILFACDYPMESSQEAVASWESAPICSADVEKIFHSNAEKLFRL
jgi:5-carboxyvanillate decarboxylase